MSGGEENEEPSSNGEQVWSKDRHGPYENGCAPAGAKALASTRLGPPVGPQEPPTSLECHFS